MKIVFKRLIRHLTKWAWRDEIDTVKGIAFIKELHATEGSMDLYIQQNPEHAQFMAHCFASLVAESPNYTEMQFDLLAPLDSRLQRLTVTIQKCGGKTPHELRMAAEKKLAELCKMAPDPTLKETTAGSVYRQAVWRTDLKGWAILPPVEMRIVKPDPEPAFEMQDDNCPVCGAPWGQHDMGVPHPYCPWPPLPGKSWTKDASLMDATIESPPR